MITFKEAIDKISDIYGKDFLYPEGINEYTFCTPVELDGYVLVSLKKDKDSSIYVGVHYDSIGEILNSNWMYPVSEELVDKVAKKYHIDYSDNRYYHLSINSLEEEEIKDKIGRFTTFVSILASYKDVGYFIYDETLDTEEDYLLKYSGKDIEVEKVKDAIFKDNYRGLILGAKEINGGYVFETLLRDENGESLTFEVKKIKNKTCACVYTNYREVKKLRKLKAIMCLYLGKYDDELELFGEQLDEYATNNINLYLSGILGHLVVANNYEFFDTFDDNLIVR